MRQRYILRNEGQIVLWQGAWTYGTAYEIGDVVSHSKTGYGTCTFICIAAHTARSASEPLIGASYASYWAEFMIGGQNGTGSGTGDVLSTGKAGGQTIYGGTESGDNLTLVSTSHATKGKIYISSYSAFLGASGYLGLCLTDPVVPLEVGVDMASSRQEDTVSGTYISFRRARGSRSSPTALSSSDIIGTLRAMGRGTSDYLTGAAIVFYAGEAFTTTMGSGMLFQTVAVGGATLTTRMQLFPSGGLVLGSGGDPGAGNFYASGNVSAASFTDRTQAFIGDALAAIDRIKACANGELDHSSLPEFVLDCYCDEHGEWQPGRSVGDMVSVLVAWAQQYRTKTDAGLAAKDDQIAALEARIEAIEKKLAA